MPICPPPPAALIAPFVGPPAPPIKGLVPGSGCFRLPRAVRAALRDMPGAVVVVEEDGPGQVSKLPVAHLNLGSRFRLAMKKELPVFPATPPMPRWMDPNVTMSGGNVVNQLFPIGWGY